MGQGGQPLAGLPACHTIPALAARPGMLRMHRAYFLIVTALTEAGTGLLLLVWPPVLFALLLGVERPSPEANLLARITGAALLAIGVTCWLGRRDKDDPARLGLITGVLLYDVAAAAILAHAGLFTGLVGIALWPAVALHATLAVWCAACLRESLREAN